MGENVQFGFGLLKFHGDTTYSQVVVWKQSVWAINGHRFDSKLVLIGFWSSELFMKTLK